MTLFLINVCVIFMKFRKDEYIINVGEPIDAPVIPKDEIYYTFIATFKKKVLTMGVNGHTYVEPEIFVQPMINDKPTRKNMKWANEHIDELVTKKYFTVDDGGVARITGNKINANSVGETIVHFYVNDIEAGRFILDVDDKIDFKDPYVKRVALLNFDRNRDGVVTMNEMKNTSITTLPFELFVNSSVTEFNEFDYMKSITEIESYSFSTCRQLHEITIPENVSYIGNYAFEMCDSLTEVHINSNTVPDIGENIFDNCPNLEIIYVPDEMFDLYYDDEKWQQYITYINNTGFDYTLNFVLS